MTKTSVRIVYDSATKTLYVSADGDVLSRAPDGDPSRLSRYCIDERELVGLTTADFDTYWGNRFDALPREVAPHARRPRSAAAR